MYVRSALWCAGFMIIAAVGQNLGLASHAWQGALITLFLTRPKNVDTLGEFTVRFRWPFSTVFDAVFVFVFVVG